MTEPRQFQDVDGLAKHWKVSRAHIYNLINAGMPSLKVGNCRRFDLAAVDRWLLERQDAA